MTSCTDGEPDPEYGNGEAEVMEVESLREKVKKIFVMCLGQWQEVLVGKYVVVEER